MFSTRNVRICDDYLRYAVGLNGSFRCHSTFRSRLSDTKEFFSRVPYAFELLDGAQDDADMVARAAHYRTFLGRARAANANTDLVADDLDALPWVIATQASIREAFGFHLHAANKRLQPAALGAIMKRCD